MPVMTLLDQAKLHGTDKVVGLIEEVRTAAPEFDVVPARTITGTTYHTALRTGLPSAGFRKVNQGVTPTKSTFTQMLVQCFILSARVEVDAALAKVFEGGPSALEAIEAAGVMKAALLAVGKQFYYGTAIDGSGFPGLQAMVTAGMTLDAGGTTADTGSSVYGVKFGQQDVQFVLGGGSIIDLGPFRDESIEDADGKKLPGRVADLTGWIGLQNLSAYSVTRLKDCTNDSGKGVTDAKLAELLSKAPVGSKPDRWFMSRRSGFQLQSSRSATTIQSGVKTKSGSEVFAPMPEESNGIPITITDSISDTEPLS